MNSNGGSSEGGGRCTRVTLGRGKLVREAGGAAGGRTVPQEEGLECLGMGTVNAGVPHVFLVCSKRGARGP